MVGRTYLNGSRLEGRPTCDIRTETKLTKGEIRNVTSVNQYRNLGIKGGRVGNSPEYDNLRFFKLSLKQEVHLGPQNGDSDPFLNILNHKVSAAHPNLWNCFP